MKRQYLIFFAFLGAVPDAILADECATSHRNQSPSDLAGSVAVIMGTCDDKRHKLEAASIFVKVNQYNKNFNQREADYFISQLTPLADDMSLDAKTRSRISDKLGVLYGIISDRLGDIAGYEKGKKAFALINEALKLDPDNAEAVLDHARAIIAIYDRGSLIVPFAERALGISAEGQAEKAKANMERLKLTSEPFYFRIKRILE